MRVSVIVFPGSNCDHDVEHVYGSLLKQQVSLVWHKERSLGATDLVVLPGGFSYGDYLRTGALAKLSPIMGEVGKFAKKGGPVLGICNGFQILCECGLLPGVLLQNIGRRFLSKFIHIKVESPNTPFTSAFKSGERLLCPVAHAEGNYFADADTLTALESEGRVVFRYCDSGGKSMPLDPACNPNGSINSIAGICNGTRNVVGLMPHPERISEGLVGGMGGDLGLKVFQSSLSLH